MKKIIAVSLLASALVAGSAMAADAAPVAASAPAAAKAMPGVMASEVVKTQATVLVINEKERTVVLRSKEGKVFEIAVPAARNLAQVKQGDIVVSEYTRAIAMQLRKTTGKASADAAAAFARAPLGERPAGTEIHEINFVANVVAVDAKASVVTLQGPQGRKVDLKVEDPKVLAEVKKGDQVEGVYIEALAISVEPKAKAKATKAK